MVGVASKTMKAGISQHSAKRTPGSLRARQPSASAAGSNSAPGKISSGVSRVWYPGGAPWLSWPPTSLGAKSAPKAVVQNPPSVATVTAAAQGPTIAAIRIRPQVQPRSLSHAPLRSHAHSDSAVRVTTISPTGPFTSIDNDRPSQNSSRVIRPVGGPPREAA